MTVKLSTGRQVAAKKAMPRFAVQASPHLQVEPESEINAIIKEFAPVVKYLAHRLAMRRPSSLGANDLMSAGMIGLMDALEKYDPSRQAKFKTYAEFRIRGAMLDEIRSMDWAPRSVREKSTQLKQAVARVQERLGRPPTEEEIAEEMGLSVDEVVAVLAQPTQHAMLSLDDLDLQDIQRKDIMEALVDRTSVDPLSVVVSNQVRRILVGAIDDLPKKQRLTLTLYYYEELTMKEIGVILEVSESRVCQLHHQAILSLKATIASTLRPEYA